MTPRKGYLTACAVCVVVLTLVIRSECAQSECGKAIAKFAQDDEAVYALVKAGKIEWPLQDKLRTITQCGGNALWINYILSGNSDQLQGEVRKAVYSVTGESDPGIKSEVDVVRGPATTKFQTKPKLPSVKEQTALQVLRYIIGKDSDAVFKVQWSYPRHIFVIERLATNTAAGPLFYVYQSNANTFSVGDWMKPTNTNNAKIDAKNWNEKIKGGEGVGTNEFMMFFKHYLDLWELFTAKPQIDKLKTPIYKITYPFKVSNAMVDMEEGLLGSRSIEQAQRDDTTITLPHPSRMLALMEFPHVDAKQCQLHADHLKQAADARWSVVKKDTSDM